MIAITYPELENAVALGDFCLLLEYDNGEKRIYDFKPNLSHSFYKELQNPSLFKNVSAVDGEIEWATGQDFCPHTLYEKSVLSSDVIATADNLVVMPR